MSERWIFTEWAQGEQLTKPSIKIVVNRGDMARDVSDEATVDFDDDRPNPLDGTRLWDNS